jgi:hypothetical protein
MISVIAWSSRVTVYVFRNAAWELEREFLVELTQVTG